MQIIRNPRKAQGVVEMALVLPLFLLVLFAIIDFGWAFHAWTSVNAQCVRAARVGSKRINQLIARSVFSSTTHLGTTEIQQAFWDARSRLTAQANFTPESPVIDTTVSNNHIIRVSAVYKYSGIIGALLPAGWSVLNLNCVAEERKE